MAEIELNFKNTTTNGYSINLEWGLRSICLWRLLIGLNLQGMVWSRLWIWINWWNDEGNVVNQ